jgi:hypothetical protein
MLPIQQLKMMSETSRNATRQLAEAALEGQEKMVRVNIDAMQEFIRTGGEGLKETCSDMAQIYPVEAWPQVVMDNIQRSTALNLNLIELTKRTQQELAVVIEEHLRALRNGTLDAIDKYAVAARTPLAERTTGERKQQAA